MISASKATTGEAPKDTDWIKSYKIDQEKISIIISRSFNTSRIIASIVIQINMDKYCDNKISKLQKDQRGTSSRRILISNEGPAMPQDTNEWNDFYILVTPNLS